MKNNLTQEIQGIPFVEYTLLKKYFSGIPTILWAYEEYFRDKSSRSFNKILREEPYLSSHIKFFKKGNDLIQKVPREDVKLEELNPKRSKVKFKEKEYSTKFMLENIMKNPQNLINKPLIINFHSQIGEQGLMAGSLLIQTLQELKRQKPQEIKKIELTSGVELEAELKDFDTGKSLSSYAKASVLGIFSQNSITSSDWNKKQFESLLDECNLNNTLVICTSKSEMKNQGRTIINIALNDEAKTESALLESIFGE